MQSSDDKEKLMSISISAVKAMEGKSTLQSEIRTCISDAIGRGTPSDALFTICEEMGAFRNTIENSMISCEADEDVRKSLRKQANNIINDVSRICRESLGYSIVCKAKKPSYAYKSKSYIPKTPKSPLPTTMTLDPAIEVLKELAGTNEYEKAFNEAKEWSHDLNRVIVTMVARNGLEDVVKSIRRAGESLQAGIGLMDTFPKMP